MTATTLMKIDYITVLQEEIRLLESRFQPEDTGHLRTTVSVLRERVEASIVNNQWSIKECSCEYDNNFFYITCDNSNYDKVYVIFQMTDPARDFGMGDKDTTIYRFTEEPHQMKLTNLTDNELSFLF